jgi:tetratricopeptide (TPR) repeat protein
LRTGAAAAILPATAFNSEPPFYETFKGGAAQPVVHLMGDASPVRRRIFGRMAAALCAARGAPPPSAKPAAADDWPPAPRWLLAEMTAGYAAAAEDASLLPEARVHALDRLGMIYHAKGRHAERAALVRRALALKEGVYGRDHPALAHEVQVLANILSELEQHEEALALMQRALALNEAARDPKGAPMPHLVAASHGDLGCACCICCICCLLRCLRVLTHQRCCRSAVWARGGLGKCAEAPDQVPADRRAHLGAMRCCFFPLSAPALLLQDPSNSHHLPRMR